MSLGLRHRLRGVRILGRSAAGEVSAALDADPVGGCMVAARFESCGMDPDRLGGTFYATASGALCFAGSNVMPLSGTPAACRELADVVASRRGTSASIVGRAEKVLPLWSELRGRWGPAREERFDQPLLTCPDEAAIPADPRVVPVQRDQVDRYFPAAVAMFTEEVGMDPTAPDRGIGYRNRIAGLIARGRAFAIFEDDTVIYKAEIGSLSRRVGLIQGVWVDPRWRGRGLAAPATAAVVRAVQRSGRVPSLYVNAYNTAARTAYRRIGFSQVGTFATVLM